MNNLVILITSINDKLLTLMNAVNFEWEKTLINIKWQHSVIQKRD